MHKEWWLCSMNHVLITFSLTLPLNSTELRPMISVLWLSSAVCCLLSATWLSVKGIGHLFIEGHSENIMSPWSFYLSFFEAGTAGRTLLLCFCADNCLVNFNFHHFSILLCSPLKPVQNLVSVFCFMSTSGQWVKGHEEDRGERCYLAFFSRGWTKGLDKFSDVKQTATVHHEYSLQQS